MGLFSWMYANEDNERSLHVGHKAYVCCPDGTFIYEPSYDGYGDFGGHDIYDLVVDWNKEDLTPEHIRAAEFWSEEDRKEDYRRRCESLNDYQNGLDDAVMKVKYSSDWKRILGIAIACYDEQNAALKYPIKITSTKRCKYEDLPASKSDPDQGWF